MRVAIVTDSNSGITQSQGKEAGVYVLPMPFMIDGQTHYEDIDLTQQQFYQKLGDGSDISTSQPSPDSILTLWKDLLKEYEQIVHIPMSSGLSGSCQTALMLAQDYEDQVFVVNNQRISVTQRQSVMDAKAMADRGMSGGEIQKVLEAVSYTHLDVYKRQIQVRVKRGIDIDTHGGGSAAGTSGRKLVRRIQNLHGTDNRQHQLNDNNETDVRQNDIAYPLPAGAAIQLAGFQHILGDSVNRG